MSHNIPFEYAGLSLKTVSFCSQCEGLDRLRGLQEVEAPRFQDNRHIKFVRLSAIHTGHLYPPPQEKFLVLISVEIESNPGSECGRKTSANEKFQ